MKITFLGAAGNVTGSRFLLETGRKTILIDCGLYQERHYRERNWEPFPFPPDCIDVVLLTHAHIDHCGYLPKLVREGFKGKIYCTGPTADITKIALLDSAHVQEHDVRFKRKRHRREKHRGRHPVMPLYSVKDAEAVFPLFKKVKYKKTIVLSKTISVTFYDAGHILGASMLKLEIQEGTSKKTYIFSGDIGRPNKPIICDPTLFEEADIVCMESTYGNRLHETPEVSLEKLARVINETKDAGGNIVVPSFAIERAQELLYYLKQLVLEKKLPHIITFIDSPMAINVLDVFERYPSYYDEEARKLIAHHDSLFNLPLLKPTRTAFESKAINHIKGTAIIIAGSGMCTGGRIKHHLLHNICRRQSTILFVGYQAQGTLGRQILERSEEVRIHGKMLPVRARIEKINGFSAHADRDELMNWLGNFKKKPQKVFVVHGESESAATFAEAIREDQGIDAVVPEYREEFVV